MKKLEDGVKEYVMTQAIITVGFPVSFSGAAEINCYHCKYFSFTSGICQLTKEVSAFPQKYVGAECPLRIIEN